jgi:hypothetical protein
VRWSLMRTHLLGFLSMCFYAGVLFWIAARLLRFTVIAGIWAAASAFGAPLRDELRDPVSQLTAAVLIVLGLVFAIWVTPSSVKKEARKLEEIRARREKMEAARSTPAPAPPVAIPKAVEAQRAPPVPCGVPPQPQTSVAASLRSVRRQQARDRRRRVLADIAASRAAGWIVLGGPSDEEPLRRLPLSREEWDAEKDPYRLLEHAVPWIPYRHTYLVIAEILESGSAHWSVFDPEDPILSRCAALLRGWCLGKAERAELVSARDAAFSASCRASAARTTARDRWHELSAAWHVTIAAARALAHVGRGYSEMRMSQAAGVLFQVLSAHSAVNPKVQRPYAMELWAYKPVTTELEVRPLMPPELAKQARKAAEASQAAIYADLIRRLIPFPQRCSSFWRLEGNHIWAGDALLYLEDGRVADARAVE